MWKVNLGATGLPVSRLSLGTDTRLDRDTGARLLQRAFELGVNFWDTDETYGTHPSIQKALKRLDRSQVVIAAKTYKMDREGARRSLEHSLREMETEYIDIFLLHAIDSARQFQEHGGALEALLEAKEGGLIRAVGLSTHALEMVEAIPEIPEIEVVLAVLNLGGERIRGGRSQEEVEEALRRSYETGQGVYLMKVLARGRLAPDLESALGYALGLPYVHSVCVGMKTVRELEMNIAIVNRQAAGAKYYSTPSVRSDPCLPGRQL